MGRIQDDRCNHRFFRPSSFSEAKPLNGYFPELVETLGKLNSVAVLDGEVVVLDEEDRSHFEFLRQETTRAKVRSGRVTVTGGWLGAPNVDVRCTGTALRDFLRASDAAPMPEELVRQLDPVGPTQEEVAVFSPVKQDR